MATKWFVIDATGTVSWSAKTEEPESFTSFKAAERRATELAKMDAGNDVYICQPVAVVRAEVSAPVTQTIKR